LIDPKLRNGYSQSSFLGVQQEITDNFNIEINGTSALGRDLITTDIVNRDFTTTIGFGRPNASFPDVSWRSSQGKSDYYALSMLARYRTQTLLLQGAYTWSHSIDNQSDPLTGDFFSLNFTSINGGANGPISSFAQQYNSNGDRGNSAFDQRHNLFLLGTWQPARWKYARGWQISWLAAFRKGTPYTVFATSPDIPDSGGIIENQRASLVSPSSAVNSNASAGTGGVYILNAAAFRQPGANAPGTSGRDAFIGPGLYNVDASLARTFSIPRFSKFPVREGTTLTFRADFYNILNHANLGNPDSLLGDPNFGLATYGRQGVASGFPATAPLNETARQVQLMIRLMF
jgi:hypothetical protein